MAVGLGGIAKGYAVDRMANILRRAGFNDALVQAGGDLLCAGTKGGKPWTAGIRDPRGGPKEVFAALRLEDHAFSTAGDYERYFMLDGKRYHHIIDPKTGQPARASRSVTVYAKTAHLADAIDDAIFIMGWKRGFEMIEKIPDVGAIVVDNEGVVHVSDRVKDRVQILYTPKNQPSVVLVPSRLLELGVDLGGEACNERFVFRALGAELGAEVKRRRELERGAAVLREATRGARHLHGHDRRAGDERDAHEGR